MITDYDLHLLGEGRHWQSYRKLGAHPVAREGVAGVHFAVWAPNASRVSVVGDFNDWDGHRTPLARLGAAGIWAGFVPGLGVGTIYKYRVEADGTVRVLGRSLAVAAGSDNIAVGSSANALLRPESVVLEDAATGAEGDRGSVRTRSFLGPVTRIEITLHDGHPLLVDLPSTIARNFQVGANVIARANTNEVVIHNQKQLVVHDE